MEGILILLLVSYLIWLLVGPIIAMVKAGQAKDSAMATRQHLLALQNRLARLESELRLSQGGAGIPPARPAESPLEAPDAEPWEEPETEPETVAEPELEAAAQEIALPSEYGLPVAPLPLPVAEIPPVVFERPAGVHGKPKEVFSLEKFMGVKLFAWLGGLAMFFGVIFFVKYAFEKDWISPAVRVAIGFATGAGLLAGGLRMHRLERYRVLAQALCATGVLILYGVTFSARAVYRLDAFGTAPTFALMSLITLVAFLLAVRLDALVVAVLGMLGGFLTPALVNTGHDNVLGLFGYIALLDIGLLAVSRHGRWRFLTSAAAIGTALMQIAWYERFFVSGRYFEGPNTWLTMGIAVFFIAVFLTGVWLNHRRRDADLHAAGAVLVLAAVAMFFAFTLLDFEQVAARYFLFYGFVLLIQVAVIAVVAARPLLGVAQVAAAGLAFLHLALWTTVYLKPDSLTGVLALYLIFGALHAVAPVVLSRRWPGTQAAIPLKVSEWFAPLVLLLMMLPVFHLSPLPLVLWAAILLADLLVIALAVATGAVLPVLASLALTMGVAAMWLLRVPVQAASPLLPFLGVITGFSLVFAVAGRGLFRRMPAGGEWKWDWNGKLDGQSPEVIAAAILPVCAGVLPFAMLILALLQLPVANPSPVFGVALLMSALLAGLAVFGKQGPLVLAALIATLAVEGVWHANHFRADAPLVALPWYLGFYLVFMLFPFVFRKGCAGQAAPWIASALSGAGHFLLVHNLVKQSWPNHMMGLVPAAFAVPALLALVAVIRAAPGMDSNNRSQLAWFGGVALLFITLIFPIQFDHQWLTVSWAMEGALLLWLFRRVPHPGLQLTGLALLGIAFARFTFNSAVFTDYERSGTAILNWQLYAYGLVAASQVFGGYWFTDPAGRWANMPARGVLFAFGGVLLFLLLNIEIADYFTHPGDRCVAFRFAGDFQRDMTYSIGWGLFSLALLGLGIWKKSGPARYAASGLLAVTLLKLFFHDLWELGLIFRVGAFIGVGVIAFLTSFIYLRFLDKPPTS